MRDPGDAYYRDVLADHQAASGDRMQVTISVGRFSREDVTDLLPAYAIAEGEFFIVARIPPCWQTSACCGK